MTNLKYKHLSHWQLIDKAKLAGWQQGSDGALLFRRVPYRTKATYYTWVSNNNDTTTEYIATINLDRVGQRSRVWKTLKA